MPNRQTGKPAPKWVRIAFVPARQKRVACRLYRIWYLMRHRCDCPTANGYERWGGKGVSVCPEWQDYAVFREWAIANGYGKYLTIDRIDADGDYCPENCRWATREQQMYNCKLTKKITFRGETLPSPVWAKRIGLRPNVLRSRINSGWTIEEALTTPKGQRRATD